MPISTILLADDDPQIFNLYKLKLERDGYRVLVARDGYEALTMAKNPAPDLILLDILMPKLTGAGVLMKLKEDPETKNIPVLMLTNLENDENLETARKLGAAGYLMKQDTDPSTLSAKVKEVLQVASGPVERQS